MIFDKIPPNLRAKPTLMLRMPKERSARRHKIVRTVTQSLTADADRDLFNAELNLAQTKRNELLSLVQLYKALGGGWQQ